MDTRVIAVLNNKGGVGKTTTTSNLSFSLAAKGNKVLAIDLDPQSHLSVSLGEIDPENSGIDDVFLDGENLAESIINVRPNLDLVPAGFRLSEVEKLASKGAKQAKLLVNALSPHVSNYDIILFDCPPTSGLLNFNALFAANEVLMPVSSDYLALHGVSQLLKTIKSTERFIGKTLKIWVALTRFALRRKLSKEIQDKLINYFPNSVLATPIRECVPLAECPAFGETIFEYRINSNGAKDYDQLADDLLNMNTLAKT